MTAKDFCYWLQGYFEVLNCGKYPPDHLITLASLQPQQVQTIRKHLALVFAHDIDPAAGGPAEQAKLNGIHGSNGSTPRC